MEWNVVLRGIVCLCFIEDNSTDRYINLMLHTHMDAFFRSEARVLGVLVLMSHHMYDRVLLRVRFYLTLFM